VVATWALPVEALATEGSVAGSAAVVAERLILTRHLVAAAGVAAALPTRTPLVGGRLRHGAPPRPLTQKGAERPSHRFLKHLIPTRRMAGEHQVGARPPGHRTRTPLQPQARVAQGQDGAVPRLVGEAARPNRQRPLGTRVRLRRRVILAGPARDQQVREEEDGVAANRAGYVLYIVSFIHTLTPTERTDPRFRGPNPCVRSHPRRTGLRIDGLQRTNASRNVR
jgi:hypothetical protein